MSLTALKTMKARFLLAAATQLSAGGRRQGGGRRAWIVEEFLRFLSGPPSEPEITAVLAELGTGEEAARRIRIALAGAREYRTY